MPLQLRTCQIQPFVADSTPQAGSLEEASTSAEIFQQQVQRYLQRLLEAICEDLQEIEAECCPTGLSP